jgi:hypothetical protein
MKGRRWPDVVVSAAVYRLLSAYYLALKRLSVAVIE